MYDIAPVVISHIPQKEQPISFDKNNSFIKTELKSNTIEYLKEEKLEVKKYIEAIDKEISVKEAKCEKFEKSWDHICQNLQEMLLKSQEQNKLLLSHCDRELESSKKELNDLGEINKDLNAKINTLHAQYEQLNTVSLTPRLTNEKQNIIIQKTKLTDDIAKITNQKINSLQKTGFIILFIGRSLLVLLKRLVGNNQRYESLADIIIDSKNNKIKTLKIGLENLNKNLINIENQIKFENNKVNINKKNLNLEIKQLDKTIKDSEQKIDSLDIIINKQKDHHKSLENLIIEIENIMASTSNFYNENTLFSIRSLISKDEPGINLAILDLTKNRNDQLNLKSDIGNLYSIKTINQNKLLRLKKEERLYYLSKILDLILHSKDGTENEPRDLMTNFKNTGKNTVTVKSGIVFRGVKESPYSSYGNVMTIKNHGFRSYNDLNIDKNAIESSGLGLWNKDLNQYICAGATGKSGVSCAKTFDGAKNYGTTIYFIDISKIGATEHAFDMQETMIANKSSTVTEFDETGGEINITNIPPQAIIGWMRNSLNGKGHSTTYDRLKALCSENLNQQYDELLSSENSFISMNPDYFVS